MSDTDYAGASGASEAGSTGGEGGYSHVAETAIKSVKDQAYDAIVRSEDISTEDFVEETRDREAEKRGDPEVNTPFRKQRRAERLQRALEAAEKGKQPEPQQDARGADAAQEGSEGASDWEAEIRKRDDAVRVTAQYEMRAEAFSQVQPDYAETIQGIFSVFPPKEHIADALLRSPVGPQLSYLLANDIDAIEELNALPPAVAVRKLAMAEGVLIERQRQQQSGAGEVQRLAQRQRRSPGGRTQPMKQLSGGAGPSRDWSQSDDMDTFSRGLKSDMERRRARR